MNRLILIYLMFLILTASIVAAGENIISKNDTKLSVEILKTEKIAEPTKYYYYLVERNDENSLIDSILLMTPICYDLDVKEILWSKDSTYIVYETFLTSDSNPQIEIFDVINRRKESQVKGNLFYELNATNCATADENLENILFYRISRKEKRDFELSIFLLNRRDYIIYHLKTVTTKLDPFYSPGLIESNWEDFIFQIEHTPSYDKERGIMIKDTLFVDLLNKEITE